MLSLVVVASLLRTCVEPFSCTVRMASVQAVDLHRSSDDFKATPEEIATISKKMEDPEFCKLWVEYMQS